MAKSRTIAKTPSGTGEPPAPSFMFEVLEPFKFRGAFVRPPAWIELTAAEAKPLQALQLLTEPGIVPAQTDGTTAV